MHELQGVDGTGFAVAEHLVREHVAAEFQELLPGRVLAGGLDFAQRGFRIGGLDVVEGHAHLHDGQGLELHPGMAADDRVVLFAAAEHGRIVGRTFGNQFQ